MSDVKPKPKTSRKSVADQASKVLRKLESPVVVKSKTMELILIADRHGALASCSPVGGAAGIIYMSGILTGNPMTLTRVAKAAGISQETVRKYKTLLARELKTTHAW